MARAFSRHLWNLAAFVAVMLLIAGEARAQNAASTQPAVLAKVTKAGAIYAVGETITFEVNPARMSGVTGRYVILRNGKTPISEGKLTLEDGASTTLSATLDGPGWVLLKVTAQPSGAEKAIEAYAGAVVAPKEIKRVTARPADFDAFWDAQVARVKAVPLNPQVEKVEVETKAGKPVDYYRVTLDNINGTHVRGQLARPRDAGDGKKFPAVLMVQYAGVYPLQRAWVTDKAAMGFLALNILAHDEVFDLPKEEFDKIAKTRLADYTGIGQTSRDTSYFLRMLLGCYQAAEYLTTRDDWDGKILLVTGTSQGGLQTIATAALHPKITHAIACVPAGCSVSEEYVGFGSWPYWPAHAKKAGISEEDKARILATAPYFDATNFARRVKAPTLVALGMVDLTCPLAGTLPMFNELGGPKEVVLMPPATHTQNQAAYSKRNDAWLVALVRGAEPPMAKE